MMNNQIEKLDKHLHDSLTDDILEKAVEHKIHKFRETRKPRKSENMLLLVAQA